MAVPYLTESELSDALRHGHPIEQWLGTRDDDGFRFIEWLRLERLRSGKWCIWHQQSLDDGSVDDIDIFEFPGLAPDEPEGVRHEFEDESAAFEYAVQKLGASPSKFVKDRDIQYLYRDFISVQGPAQKRAKEWFRPG